MRELRANPELPVSIRKAQDTENTEEGSVVEGYAAIYGARTIIWGLFEEEISDGFFNRALDQKQDVRSLYNHDPNFPLARTKSGTLTLRVDEKGLWTESRTPNTPIANSIVESIRRGDVDGMSFAFTVKRQEWVFAEEGSGKMDLRKLLEIDTLYDVGPVTYPAYEQTSVKVREETTRAYQEARARWQERSKKVMVSFYDTHGENLGKRELPLEHSMFECRSDSGLWVPESVEEIAQGEPIDSGEPIVVPEEVPVIIELVSTEEEKFGKVPGTVLREVDIARQRARLTSP